jgi:Rps23 Pro-64 3,4-dihydroxylase Tpa1-like proline 4-hydroxylase
MIKEFKMNNSGIEFYYNVFENPELLIETFNKFKWTRPENVSHDDRSNSVIYLTDKKLYSEIFDMVEKSVKPNVINYCNKYHIPELEFNIIEALKYEPDEKYVTHYDNGSKHVASRITSCVIYLNDNYDGGEIEFNNFDIKVKPQKNSMVLFPSNYPYAHTAHIVKSGTRYAINFFMEYK